MKKVLFLFILLTNLILNAQEEKTITLTVTGTGKTLEEAKTNALRSAIEQAFGAFISSKTEILNDNLVKDEIVSISNGNIKSFEILNESQFSNKSWGIAIKVIVSIEKLTDFAQAKGISIEVKGGLFALNIKQQLLNEQNEEKVIYNMIELMHENMQTSFDYSIESSQIQKLESNDNSYLIPLKITVKANKNLCFCSMYFLNTLKAISLSKSEIQDYKSLNKKIYSLIVGDNKIYFRNENSVRIIKSFLSNWEFYIRNFVIDSGFDKKNSKGEILKTDFYHLFKTNLDFNSKHDPYYLRKIVENGFYDEIITFPIENQTVAYISYSDIKTLTEIEKLTNYTIKSRGILSKFKFGGYVVYEKNGHGLVALLYDLKDSLYWADANKSYNNLNFNGFTGWRLPTKMELNLVYNNLFLNGIGNFYCGQYGNMDNTIYWANEACVLNFKTNMYGNFGEGYIRLVRTF